MRMRRLIDDLAGWVVAAIGVLAVAFLVLPLAISILMSFDARSFFGPFPPPELSTGWYEKFFDSPVYRSGIVNTVVIATIATAVSVSAGTAAAIALHRARFPGRAALLALFLSPLVVPAVVLGFGLLLVLSGLGIVDGMARMILGHIVVTFPYVVRATAAGLTGIGRSLEEAAMSLGAGEWRVIWTVILPLCRTGVVVGAVLGFAISIDDVSVGIFLSDPDSMTLPLALVSMMRSNFDLTIAAASVVLIAAAALLILVLELLIGMDRVIGRGTEGR